MNNSQNDDYVLYNVCYTNLLEIRMRTKKYQEYPTKAEALAQLAICEAIFELAAGAAVRQKMKKYLTDALVQLKQEIDDYFEWNHRK